MDKFLKRSRPSTSGTSVNSGGGELNPKKNRRYDDSYLKYGFTVINNKPQCVICGDVLSRESMKPSKLMRHLTTKHQKEADKPLDFFERKLKALSQQQNTIIQASSVNESSLLASYKVAYRVAKAGKPHTIAENLILPAALDMVEIMVSSAVAMIGANLRFGSSASNATLNSTRVFQCHPGGTAEAALIFALGSMGMAANVALMGVILANRQLRRWSQGLLFHQAAVDCLRAALLLPLGISILRCQPVQKCSLVETAFLLLVTVATVNMLTTVLNDSPIFPDHDEEDETEESAPLLMDSPQCVLFGTFMIWFASITINLGPTFLSGALAAQAELTHRAPSCPLIHGPLRHYVLNVLWIAVNLICVLLTLFHLRKLHRDLTKANVEAVRVAGLVTSLVNVTGGSGVNQDGERAVGALEEHRRMREYLRRMEKEGVQRVKMFLVITAAYVLFWGPLFFVTLIHHPIIGNPLGYEITLHISYIHAIVNPTLFMVLHRGLRKAVLDICCGWIPIWLGTPSVPPPPDPPRAADISYLSKSPLPPPAESDSSMGNTDLNLWIPEPLNGGVQIPHYTSPTPGSSPESD